MGKLQPCGHPIECIVSSDEGTHYCGWCASLAKASYTMPSTWNPLMQALSELYRVYSKHPRLTYSEVDSKVAALMEIYDEWLD